MNAERSPAVALDSGIHILCFSPLSSGDGLPVLAGDAWQAAMLIRLATIGAAIRSIDKTVREFCRLRMHTGCCGGSNQSHHYRWPAQRRPLAAVLRRLCQNRARLLYMPRIGDVAKDWGQMHRVSFAGPDASHRIIVAEPAVTPHQTRLHRKFFGDLTPESYLGRIGVF